MVFGVEGQDILKTGVVLLALSSLAIISLGKRDSAGCFSLLVSDVLCLFLAVPWVGLKYVTVSFPCQTQLLFLEIIGV